MRAANRYSKIIEAIFIKNLTEGSNQVPFERHELEETARELGLVLPKNLGDLIYSFRYRYPLPESVRKTAPEGFEWVIRPAGVSRYQFVLVQLASVQPSSILVETKMLEATPGIIDKYALNDEQALLAKLRYNRLIDIFLGITCYSLQNHLRTTVPDIGQIETDEIYVGVDKRGAHFVVPVQVKGGSDKIGIIQIEQDIAMCAEKFPGLICRPVAAQLIERNKIALFEFEVGETGVAVFSEKHFRLVPVQQLSDEELAQYRRRME